MKQGAGIGPGINFPELHLAPSSLNVSTGTPTGTVDDIKQWQDGNILNIQEAAATPGSVAVITFTGVKSFRRVGISMAYVGSATHWEEVQLFDNNSMTWKKLHTYETGNGLNYRYSDIPPSLMPDFIDENGDVVLRLYHPVGGNAAHNLQLDYVTLVI